jgi:hypothetical protein
MNILMKNNLVICMIKSGWSIDTFSEEQRDDSSLA